MPTIITNNQQPAELNSFHMGSLAGQFDPFTTVKNDVIAPLFSPLIQGSPVTISCDGKDMTPDDITASLFSCCDDRIDIQAEELMKEIFSHTLVYYDKTMSVQETYSVQAGKKLQMLLPSSRVMYTPTDVIDSAKQFLAGQLSADGFFATMAFYTRVQTFGYYFANETAWENFKTFFSQQIAAIQNLITPETQNLCTNLQNISLNKLTEGFVIRDDETQNNDPYTFARILPFYLMMYEQQRQQSNLPVYTAGHMPFSVSDNFCPRTIVLINVEKHAHAHPNEIKRDWDIIKNAMMVKPRVMGNNQIANLTAASRMAAKMQGYSQAKQDAQMQRSAIIRFRKTAPTSVDIDRKSVV